LRGTPASKARTENTTNGIIQPDLRPMFILMDHIRRGKFVIQGSNTCTEFFFI
jgi:hypothetical protein